MSETAIRAFELPLHNAPADVWPLIRECWRTSTELANWCVTQMLKLDDPLDEQGKLKKAPEFDLYAHAFGRVAKEGKEAPSRKPGFPKHSFFECCKKEGAGLIRDVQREYLADRFEIYVRRSKSPRIYKQSPWALNGQQVKDVWLDPNGRPFVRLTLPGGQVELQMRNGRDFVPQMAKFKDLVEKADSLRKSRERDQYGKPLHSTSYAFKEVVLREKQCRGGDVLVKFVCEVPVREKTGDRVMVLSTDPQCFWIAEIDRRKVWILNNDHVRRNVARLEKGHREYLSKEQQLSHLYASVRDNHEKHLTQLQRMSEDAKAERRLGNNKSWQQQTRLDVLCEKDRNRLKSFSHEACCHVAEFARRQGVGTVLYLDRDKGFIPKFPWHSLVTGLRSKLEERGISFHAESEAVKTSETNDYANVEVNIQPSTEDDRWSRACRVREIAIKKLAAAMNRKGAHPKVSSR